MPSPRLLIPLLLPLLAGPAIAQQPPQRHDSQAPVDFSASHIELQDKNHRSILSGGVTLKQAEMTLTAARMTVYYTGQVLNGSPQVTRFDAAGSVVVTRPGQTAHSQYAVYDLNKHLITMLGAVSLTQGGDTINGGRLTLNLDTGRAVVDGSAVAGSASNAAPGTVVQSSGRVTGRFSVPQRQTNAAAAAPASNATATPGNSQ